MTWVINLDFYSLLNNVRKRGGSGVIVAINYHLGFKLVGPFVGLNISADA